MLLLTFAIFVTLIAAPVNGRRACCYPVRMEGARYYVEQKETRYFVADYVRGYVLTTLQIGGPNFTVLDLHKQKIYTVRDGECKETKMPLPGLFDPCVHTDEMVQKNAILGGEDETIDVDFYDYKVEDFSIFKAVKRGKDGCIPVTTQVSIDGETMTNMYENIRTHITYPGIFSALKICNVKVRRWK